MKGNYTLDKHLVEYSVSLGHDMYSGLVITNICKQKVHQLSNFGPISKLIVQDETRLKNISAFYANMLSSVIYRVLVLWFSVSYALDQLYNSVQPTDDNSCKGFHVNSIKSVMNF